MEGDSRRIEKPERIATYFHMEKWTLAVITVTGIFYNVGMTAGPWFEGQLAQRLCDIILGKKVFADMVGLALLYVAVILVVQTMRYMKRLFVRRFANHINRDMKQVLYHSLVHKKKEELEKESAGAMMTRAISDVDVCVEGMRKFTTEIFDTGVVMAAYLVMLFIYDWRLTLLSMCFPPAAYFIAEKLKKTVSRCAAAGKESAGRLNEATLDRVENALTYRVYGQDENRNADYEICLADYEKKAVSANIWENAMQPLYQIISMMGAVFILWFGGKNVLGSGWTAWDIAAFTTFLSCFTKLAAKSSKAAKLFNSVQKAQVSWKRIQPFMQDAEPEQDITAGKPAGLVVSGLSFSYQGGPPVFQEVSFSAGPGEIIGVTGPVACGKSTLGRVFLQESAYQGSIRIGGRELSGMTQEELSGMVGYMGHQPELISADIEENILLGDEGNALKYLRAVRMEEETAKMPDGIHTLVGNGGVRLSGGQQARIALARTLCHRKPVMILDDPFSAVDTETEKEIMKNLRELARDSIVLLLTHRLVLFPELNQVLWMSDGRVTVSCHEELMRTNADYAALYRMQEKGGGHHEA